MTVHKNTVRKPVMPINRRKLAAAPIDPPHYPPIWEPADAEAFKALERGDASAHLQKRALKWLIHSAADTYNLSWRVDSERATSFAEGRRFVGLQIIKLLTLNTNILEEADKNG